jgi:hypothetical protein
MHNYSECSLETLHQMAKKAMLDVTKDVLSEHYSEVEDPEHKNIKVFAAQDRVKMYIATNVADTTFYAFNLDTLLKYKKRKTLIKIIDACDTLTYLIARNAWFNEGLKELFYVQKEEKRYSAKLATICIIVRNLTQNAFVAINKGEVTLVQDSAKASEFIATSDNESALDDVEDSVQKHFKDDELKVFFNAKLIGRTHAS